MKPKNTLRSFLLGSISLAVSPLIHAANIWDGGGTDNNSNTANNWDNNAVPAANAQLTFAGTVRPTVVWNGISGGSVNSSGFTFSAGAAAFQINSGTANAVQFITNSASTLLNSSSNLQTLGIESRVFFNGTKTFNAGTAGLALNGGIVYRGDGMSSGQINRLDLIGSGDSTTSTISRDNFAGTATTSLVKNGTGKWTITGNVTDTGATTITQGTLEYQGSISSSSISNNAAMILNNANATSFAYANNITGSGTVTKSGLGAWTLSGTNTFTGQTTVSAGALTLAGSSSGTLGSIQVGGAGTATLNIQAGNYTQGGGGFFVGANGTGIVDQTGGAVSWNNSDLQLLIGNGGFAGTYNLSGGSMTTHTTGNAIRGVILGVNTDSSATFNLSGTGNLTVNSTNRLMIGRSDSTENNTTSLFSQSGGTATITGLTIGGGGANAATARTGNTATMTLTGGTFTATNFFSLAAAHSDNSTINIGGTAVVTLPNFPTLRGTSATATLNFDGGTLNNSATGTFITGLTNAFIEDGGATFDTSLNSTTISQNLLTHGSSLNGGLTKIGTNTLTLSGTNTYTGTTTIKTGTLALSSGTIANSATIVVGDAGSSGTVLDLTSKASFAFGSGQTVKGIGTINIGAGKTITINGTLAKGNSIGTQAYTGNLTLAGNDQIELGNSTGAGTYASPYNSDLGNVSGDLTLGGTLSVINNAGADSNGSISAGSYLIYTYLGTTSGSYSGITNATGYRADIVNNGAGTGSGKGIYLDNYRVAAAASTQTVTLNTRTGVAVSTSLSITNANNSTAPYQESLGTTGFSGTTSGYTATGSATGIAGGASGSGSLTVGVNAGTVGTAGTYSGSTTLGLQTEEVNSSGLGNAGFGNQTLTINVNAYDFATAAFSQTGGAGSLTGSGVSYTLDFGNSLAINTNYTATLQLANGMLSLYKDSLQGVYGTLGGPFSETAGNFGSLTSGGTDNFTVSFFSGSTGTFTDTLSFNGTSLNTPLGNSALSQINIGITATVIPEPNVAALVGALGFILLLRRRR